MLSVADCHLATSIAFTEFTQHPPPQIYQRSQNFLKSIKPDEISSLKSHPGSNKIVFVSKPKIFHGLGTQGYFFLAPPPIIATISS